MGTPDVGGEMRPASLQARDEDLVERARSDPEAFAELYRRHVTAVHAFAYRRSRSVEVADEITSSTFERALRGLPSFRWRDGGLSAWLYRIAANELASYYRRAQRQRGDGVRRAGQPLHTVSAEDELAGTPDRHDVLLAALGTLNERYQKVITLRYFAGLSQEEAATAMGLSKPTFAVVLHRALGALRRAMDGRGHEEGS